MMKSKYLTSSDLRNISLAKKKKRILLINPKRKDIGFTFPHNGLASLGTLLKKRGHEVLIIDYAFSFEDQKKEISFFINDFKPDVIGMSIYTPNAYEADKMISEINEFTTKTPLMIGGPHATLYFDLFIKDKRIDYIFKGEAELTIIPVAENAKKEKTPRIIESKEIVNLKDLPFPDFKIFHNWKLMTNYPIMTSRGCPFQCSFCASAGLSYRKWRARDPDNCIKELELSQKEISPNLKFVVFDDNPITIKERFHKFLELYSKRIKAELTIVNVRADCIDEKFLILAKKCNVRLISIGVEHAHPEVFKLINKGETLEQIEHAANLIKKHNISLGLSFVIGLPNDNLNRIKESIRFCKRVKADEFSINQILPYRCTSVRKWFEEHNAKLYNEIGYDAQPLSNFECQTPVVETPDFTKEQREKAFYLFLFGVADPRLKFYKLPKILSITKRYKLYGEFFSWIPKGIISSIKEEKKYLTRGIFTYKTYGFKYFLKRYFLFLKQNRII